MYIGFNAWVKAVEKAGTFKADPVIDALIGVSVPNLSGGYSTVMPNHHITKPVYIGEIQADGQMNTVWQTPGLVVAQEWSPYLEGSKDLIGDWRQPDELRQLQREDRQVRRRGVSLACSPARRSALAGLVARPSDAGALTPASPTRACAGSRPGT